MDFADSSWLFATAAARRDSSTRASPMKPCLNNCSWRAASRSATRWFASACARSWPAFGAPTSRHCWMRVCAAASAARACASAEASSACSSSTSGAPASTWSPSSAGTACTRPVIAAPMSALAGASTRPLTTTDCVMRVDSTRATSTAVPRWAKYAASASATAPTATIARTPRERRNAGMVASAAVAVSIGRKRGSEPLGRHAPVDRPQGRPAALCAHGHPEDRDRG